MATSLRLPPELEADIKELAREHERSDHGEMIYALRFYVAQHKEAKPRPTTFYVKLDGEGQPTGEFLIGCKFWNDDVDVQLGEQWKLIEAQDIEDLQHKMKVFR
jgi:hypothetical protein